MPTRSETAANITVTAMALVVTFAVAKQFIFPRFLSDGARSGYRIGEQLTATTSDLPLARAPLSAVIVISSNCRYCIESIDFYRRLSLTRENQPRSFQTIFVGMRDPGEAGRFVKTFGVPADHTAILPGDVRARIPGTPALLLVSRDGRVTGIWVGKLTPREEEVVLSSLWSTSRPAISD